MLCTWIKETSQTLALEAAISFAVEVRDHGETPEDVKTHADNARVFLAEVAIDFQDACPDIRFTRDGPLAFLNPEEDESVPLDNGVKAGEDFPATL